MPEIQINGAPCAPRPDAAAILKTQAPHIGLEACYEALGTAGGRRTPARDRPSRSAARERFAHFFRRLGLDETALPVGFGRTLIDATVGARTRRRVPGAPRPTAAPARRALSTRSRLELRLHTHGARYLERAGVVELFDAVVVSDEVGWRKPRRDIFDAAFVRLAYARRSRCSSAIAPTWTCSAPAARMDAPGSTGRGAAAARVAPPTYEIRDLASWPSS